jgi:spore maturation protein CgeB
MSESQERGGLTPQEWKDLQVQIAELFDITLRYAEIVAKESDKVWDRDRPKFVKPKDASVDDALAEYQKRLREFEDERQRAYEKNYSRIKADSFDRVVKIEKYVERLAAAVGVNFSVGPDRKK